MLNASTALRPMSHLQFSRAILSRENSRDKIASVMWRVAQVFKSRNSVSEYSSALFCATLLTECWTLIDATLSRGFVAHWRDKIVWENCRCDVGLKVVCRSRLSLMYRRWWLNVQVDSKTLRRTPGLAGGSRRAMGKKRRSKAVWLQPCDCCKGRVLCQFPS